VLSAIRPEPVIIIGALALISLALALTFSRGALLGAGAGLAVFAVATRKRRPRPRPNRSRLALLGGSALVAVGAGIAVLGLSDPATLRLTTQSDLEWYRADLHGALPGRLHPNSLITVPVTAHNPGPLTWRAGGTDPFHIGYHWLLPDDRMLVLDGLRTRLPHNLKPGQSVTVQARVLTPRAAGRYRLEWDIAEENVAWFNVHTGTLQARDVVVSGRSGRARIAGRVLAKPLPFPTAPSQPERSVLWAAALRMIRAHPLLGVGPNGYRLTYGRYEQPPQSSWDTRIYANSLPLEVGADLGLAGLVLFLAFLLSAAGPAFVRSLRDGRTEIWPAAILAALAVLLAHGAVDYLLGSRAVLLLFWITLGLIAALPAPAASPLRMQTTPNTEVAPRK
jgi:hypothetical protein